MIFFMDWYVEIQEHDWSLSDQITCSTFVHHCTSFSLPCNYSSLCLKHYHSIVCKLIPICWLTVGWVLCALMLSGSPMPLFNPLLCGHHWAHICISQHLCLWMYQHLLWPFTTQYANQISQSLSHLTQIATFPCNPWRIFMMYININMWLVSLVSIWETSIFLDTHSFQMPPSDLCVKYGISMISLQFSWHKRVWRCHQLPCIVSFPLMDCLIPLFSLHSPNNCPCHRSHRHTYQALLPPLTFPWRLVFFPALQLTVTCLLLSSCLPWCLCVLSWP